MTDTANETAVGGDIEDVHLSAEKSRHRNQVVCYVLLPLLVMVGALNVGFLKWRSETIHVIPSAAAQSVVAATDAVTAMLSYQPESVDKELRSASERLAGPFRDQYLGLIDQAVIPGAKQKRVAAVATVPQAALISADSTHAEVLVYIDQSISVNGGAPTQTLSSARVGLDEVGGRWLVSDFQPI